MTQYSINITLCVCAKDIINKESEYLISSGPNNIYLPNKELIDGKTCLETAIELMELHTGITSNWVIPISFGIIDNIPVCDNIRKIIALYGIFIPEKTLIRIDEDAWYTYDKLDGEKEIAADTLKLIHETIWRP